MYCMYYRLIKSRLDKYLKSAVSQYPSTSNMVNAFKHISNHKGRTNAKIFSDFFFAVLKSSLNF